jgi:carboxyl-terminal processing protease
MTFLRSFLISLAILLLLIASFFSGYMLRGTQNDVPSFHLLSQAYDILTQNSLKEPPVAPALEYGMIRGMLQTYNDPYTVFLEPPQHELESNNLEGKFGGIGVQLGKDPEGNWVLFPFTDSPASQAGIVEGDRLLAVDELQINSTTSEDMIQAAIRGPVGTRLNLTVGRSPDYSPIQHSIKRKEIPLPSIAWHIDPSQPLLGILDINLIASSTPDEIQRAIKEMQGRGATHFVMDLRDNPGGLLTSGIDVARLFLNDGVILQEQYRDLDVQTFKVDHPGSLADLPLAVLINHGSASAAEITAGALKVHHRALLIGLPSFGKDTIQLVFELSDKSSLHVTAAHWWIPGLEPPIGGNGLQPDIIVESTPASNGIDPAIQAAILVLFGTK